MDDISLEESAGGGGVMFLSWFIVMEFHLYFLVFKSKSSFGDKVEKFFGENYED